MATYYVDGAVGDDGNAGTSEGAGNAWATINKAMDTVAAGDKVNVKASVTYLEDVELETAGTSTSQILFEGYTTTPGDGGRVKIDGQNTRECLSGNALTAGNAYYVFKNFWFYDGIGSSVVLTNVDNCTWVNCRFSHAGIDGVVVDEEHGFIFCEFDNNAGKGAQIDQRSCCIFCSAHNNGTTNAIRMQSGVFYGCVGYENVGVIFRCDLNAGLKLFLNNTVDGRDAASTIGLKVEATAAPEIFINNSVRDCAVGITSGTDRGHAPQLWNNNVYSCTTAMSNIQDGENLTTTDPGHTDAANDDYTLTQSGEAWQGGIDVDSLVEGDSGGISGTSYADIGAFQRNDSGAVIVISNSNPVSIRDGESMLGY